MACIVLVHTSRRESQAVYQGGPARAWLADGALVGNCRSPGAVTEAWWGFSSSWRTRAVGPGPAVPLPVVHSCPEGRREFLGGTSPVGLNRFALKLSNLSISTDQRPITG